MKQWNINVYDIHVNIRCYTLLYMIHIYFNQFKCLKGGINFLHPEVSFHTFTDFYFSNLATALTDWVR